MAELIADTLRLSVPATVGRSATGSASGTAVAVNRLLLDDATLRFGTGECWCIVGPNGAGKTTLLETLAGLRKPAAGQIMLDGRALSNWPAAMLARRRAYLPQRQHDAFAASVLDTVLIGRHPHLAGWGWHGEEGRDREVALEALSAVDMVAFANNDVRGLSGGERQRVALATMLAQQATLLLCDEPLTHLDLKHQLTCLDLLRSCSAQGAATVLFVCHDLTMARAFASHALLLDGQGGYTAGTAAEALSAAPLSQAFGVPIVSVQDGTRHLLTPLTSSFASSFGSSGVSSLPSSSTFPAPPT